MEVSPREKEYREFISYLQQKYGFTIKVDEFSPDLQKKFNELYLEHVNYEVLHELVEEAKSKGRDYKKLPFKIIIGGIIIALIGYFMIGYVSYILTQMEFTGIYLYIFAAIYTLIFSGFSINLIKKKDTIPFFFLLFGIFIFSGIIFDLTINILILYFIILAAVAGYIYYLSNKNLNLAKKLETEYQDAANKYNENEKKIIELIYNEVKIMHEQKVHPKIIEEKINVNINLNDFIKKFSCPYCGAPLNIDEINKSENNTVKCEYCGQKFPIPKEIKDILKKQ